MEADTDRDGKISFEEFTKMVENTDVSMSMTLGTLLTFRCVCFGPLCSPLQIHSLERQVQTLTSRKINSRRYPDSDSGNE